MAKKVHTFVQQALILTAVLSLWYMWVFFLCLWALVSGYICTRKPAAVMWFASVQ